MDNYTTNHHYSISSIFLTTSPSNNLCLDLDLMRISKCAFKANFTTRVTDMVGTKDLFYRISHLRFHICHRTILKITLQILFLSFSSIKPTILLK